MEQIENITNPFTNVVDCSIRFDKNREPYIVCPWGPITLKAKGYKDHCRGLIPEKVEPVIEDKPAKKETDKGPAPVIGKPADDAPAEVTEDEPEVSTDEDEEYFL